MVKMIMLIFLMIQVTMAANLPELIQENRVKIGPTVNPPIEFQGKLYFLANSGVLFESNYDLSEIKNLFETELASFSPITLHEGVLYFGEGLHEHKKANLYAYDLKEKKLKFKMKLEGHIERAISIVDGIAYLGFGPGGIGAIDLSQQKIIWQKKEIKAGVLHVDSNIIVYQKNICATSVYNYKGVFCLNAADGSELFNVSLRLSPKSEITLDGELLYGFSTEATMNDMNWKTPTSFYVVNLVKKNIQMEIELRGYNFFAPLAI
jgi:outer membrane protein assembly factor BamB